MVFAKQSTAIIVTVGPVLDADGVAVTDGVVGDFKASKNGGAPAALNASATLTHRATGHYSLSLTTSDTDTVGTLEIIIDDTTNACPMKEIQVVETAIYDSLFADGIGGLATAAALDAVDNFIDTEIGTIITDIAAVKADTAAILVDTGTTLDGKIDTIDSNVDAILVDTGTTLDGKLDTIDTNVDAILVDTGTTLQAELDGIQADTEDIQSKIGTPAGVSVSADIAAVKSDTVDIEGKVDTVDTVADAIKAKTDGLTFTVAGSLDANVQKINDVDITGDGASGTEFGV